jgi:hypothetical protein
MSATLETVEEVEVCEVEVCEVEVCEVEVCEVEVCEVVETEEEVEVCEVATVSPPRGVEAVVLVVLVVAAGCGVEAATRAITDTTRTIVIRSARVLRGGPPLFIGAPGAHGHF